MFNKKMIFTLIIMSVTLNSKATIIEVDQSNETNIQHIKSEETKSAEEIQNCIIELDIIKSREVFLNNLQEDFNKNEKDKEITKIELDKLNEDIKKFKENGYTNNEEYSEYNTLVNSFNKEFEKLSIYNSKEKDINDKLNILNKKHKLNAVKTMIKCNQKNK